MKNYQSLHYIDYRRMFPNGDSVIVSRKECFAPAVAPTAANPFKQRWYYDPESGFAIRLPRNQEGDILGKRNAADLKSEERFREQKYRCVWQGTKNCDQDCVRCNRQHTSRTVELDKSWGNDNDPDLQSRFDIADEAADIEEIIADGERLGALIATLNRRTLRFCCLVIPWTAAK